MKETKWRWAWVAWLVLFLCIELPAACLEKGSDKAKTLSRNVWLWFDQWWERVVFVAFWVVLGLHLSPLHTSVVPVMILGAVVGFVIVRDSVRKGDK